MTKEAAEKRRKSSDTVVKLASRLAREGVGKAAIRHILKTNSHNCIASALNWRGQIRRAFKEKGDTHMSIFLRGCREADKIHGPESRFKALVDMGILSGTPRQADMPKGFGSDTGYIVRNGILHALDKGRGRKAVARALSDLSLPDIPAKVSPKRLFAALGMINNPK